jgi:hypothetical protein
LPLTRVGELQAFLDQEWRRGHVLAADEALLRWQHRRDNDELSFVVADDGGELVGVLGVIAVELSIHGRRVSGAWLTTWVVAADLRRRQLGLRLLEFVLDAHDFVGTLGGNTTTMSILRALRFHTRTAVPRWLRPLDVDALEVVTGRRLRAQTLARPAATIAAWRPEHAEPWNRVWRERIGPAMVGVARDAAYLDWRYLSHPRFRYELHVATDPVGDPSALLVHRVEHVRDLDATVVRIVDALGDPDGVAALAAELVHRGTANRAAFADFYCTAPRLAAPLAAAGFVEEASLDEPLPTRFQPIERPGRPLTASLRLASWTAEDDPFAGDDVYFTRSDCDQDRPS